MFNKFKNYLMKNIFYMYSYPELEANMFLPTIVIIIGLILTFSYMYVYVR